MSPPTVADYDAIVDEAVDAFDAQDYARARVLFERALALRPNARVLRGMGIASLHLKRFTAAKRELTAALSDSRQPLTAAQREGVSDLLEWMQSHLGTVQLKLDPANAQVALDDEPMTAADLVMEPGAHRLRVSAEGYETQEHSLRIAAGEFRSVDVSLLRRPSEATALAPALDAIRAPAASRRETAPRPIAVQPVRARDEDSSSVLESWWFWTAVGVVVAGGVATALVLTSKEPERRYERGGLGGVIIALGRGP